MSSHQRAWILAFAVIGLGLAVEASVVSYHVFTDPSYISPCNINATFNCSNEYLSRFGSVHGIPTALGGILWFALVALVAAMAKPAATKGTGGAALFALSVVGLAVVFYLAYASVFVLKTYCLFCMGVWASVLAIFIVSSLTAGSFGDLPGDLVRDVSTLLARSTGRVAALLYVCGAVALLILFPRAGALSAKVASAPPPPAGAEDAFRTAWAAQPRVDLGIPADGAKVIIVKFNDYECPACREAELSYQPILKKFAASDPGAVKYVLKDWPWNSTCNFNVPQTFQGHEASCVAAAAARMARDRGKFDEMTAWLFANQDTTIQAVTESAQRILGIADFDREYASVLPNIRRDVADGAVLKIVATPTFFINGVRLPEARTIEAQYFELAIDIELHK